MPHIEIKNLALLERTVMPERFGSPAVNQAYAKILQPVVRHKSDLFMQQQLSCPLNGSALLSTA
jgi:hypothetical protein